MIRGAKGKLQIFVSVKRDYIMVAGQERTERLTHAGLQYSL